MTRMTVDCRTIPSESGCTMTLYGEPDDLLRAAVAHAVDAHGHTDDEELRDVLRGAMRPASALDLGEGAFVQVIEFRAAGLDGFDEAEAEWLADIGDARTATWSVIAADRDDPGRYLQLVAFPDYESAMRNSKHPATGRIAERIREMTEGEQTFRNLDVQRVAGL
ncbi:DUF1059 domain-containing protein [Pseudonocardia pini]|uniref:DUF1059 domain-containing protein n=1 Tax=Pseudonocardia pini TaxID=2758030 RepID=UPI0015F0D850|nr:DUF1059 domain-containing protein [Pseudonocardia pini]